MPDLEDGWSTAGGQTGPWYELEPTEPLTMFVTICTKCQGEMAIEIGGQDWIKQEVQCPDESCGAMYKLLFIDDGIIGFVPMEGEQDA